MNRYKKPGPFTGYLYFHKKTGIVGLYCASSIMHVGKNAQGIECMEFILPKQLKRKGWEFLEEYSWYPLLLSESSI